MAYDRFLIAPYDIGQETDMKPWQIPDQSFEELRNAYVFRGRVRKRFGSQLMGLTQLNSRLRIALSGGAGVGITDGTGAATGTVPGAIFKVGQIFSIGTEIFTVVVTGAPGVMKTTGASTTMTYNTTTGAYVFGGAALTTQIYFYPAEPVMGITQYETQSLINNPTYAFDTQFAYIFSGGSWARLGTGLWHNAGSTSKFFWATNWNGLTADTTALFVSNFQAALGGVAASDDPIKYWNGATWTDFYPNILTSNERVFTARIVLPFKDRLVLLNTIEQNAAHTTNIQYPNRCRFSHNGSPLAANAFLEPNQAGADGGGCIDAPTEEEIISAEFIRDRLVVCFERSTWELAYTGNQVQPFLWQKLNTELGSVSTFSSVPFDKVILTIGATGIHACNGANVERIDTQIPDQIFQIRIENDGIHRVAGIRDYYTELVYWSYPVSNADTNSRTYPNRILVYNYRNNTWAINDDCITAFGYYEQQTGYTWVSTDLTWEKALFAWNSGVTQARFKDILAGNQQGFVIRLNADISTNAPSMQITNITVGTPTTLTIVDHTFESGDYIKIENVSGTTGLNNTIFQVSIIDANTVSIGNVGAGAYLGGGTVRRVSYINILTKRFNPYAKSGKNVFIAKADFAVQKTTNGEITVDYYPSSTQLSMIDQAQVSGCSLGTNVLETKPFALVPLENVKDMLWHPVYFQSDGEFIQFNLYLTDEQMTNTSIVESGFELDGMVLFCKSLARLQ